MEAFCVVFGDSCRSIKITAPCCCTRHSNKYRFLARESKADILQSLLIPTNGIFCRRRYPAGFAAIFYSLVGFAAGAVLGEAVLGEAVSGEAGSGSTGVWKPAF